MRLSRRTFLQMSGAAVLVPPWKSASPRSTDAASVALCRKLASDPLRPQYHLMPAHNWMNDPNGPIFFRGHYHMFHQYNPEAAIWGNMNWAHATSNDMIHWHHEPIALSPTPGGPDRDGVFSGSAVIDKERPVVIYTAVAPPATEGEATLRDGVHTWRETQCLAVAQDDDLRKWKKLPDPVIAAPPAGLSVTGFRDPCLWREGDLWMLVLGSGFPQKGGAILLYSSPDLRRWTYLHPLVESPTGTGKAVNPVDSGEMWECPDFFPLGNKHVLLISTMGKVHWKVGSYASLRFTPEKEGIVDWGSYYAAKTMLDEHGNRILWGWITETRPEADLIAAGWAGAMSLPRVLALNSKNELEMDVAPAARQLRSGHVGFSPETSPARSSKIIELFRVQGLAAELIVEIQPKADGFSFHLQAGDGKPFVTISCTRNADGCELRVNKVTAPLPGSNGSRVHLHMFLDGSVVEIFVNKTISMTVRTYEIPSGTLLVKPEGDSEFISFDAWQMSPISKDRLTGPLCS